VTEPDGVAEQRIVPSAGRNGAARARLRRMLDEHYDVVYHAMRRFGVREAELEDAVQKVFLVASTKLDAILPGRDRAFFLATGAIVAAHARRTQVRRREVSEEEAAVDTFPDEQPLPDEMLERQRRRALFYQVLAAMDEDIQTVFVLFELEGMLTKDIAIALGLPTGTVASRLRRAREEFTHMATRAVGQTSRAT
jgi:RNA polymerase sigma-70 factor (ECF subfamily)